MSVNLEVMCRCKSFQGRLEKQSCILNALPRKDLTQELNYFLKWFNGRSSQSLDGLIRAGIAHLWFEILHPFDDGNGRVGRTIVDMVLAQDEQLAMRFYSLSLQIMEERKSYYQILDKTCKGNLDITEWLRWFLTCYRKAIVATLDKINGIVKKSQFWQVHAKTQLNEWQRKVLNRLLDEGIKGFKGDMTTRKYIALTKTSRATAYRRILSKKIVYSRLKIKRAEVLLTRLFILKSKNDRRWRVTMASQIMNECLHYLENAQVRCNGITQ